MENNPEIQILSSIIIDKTFPHEFFTKYRNRYLLFHLSSFLQECEKINLLYLNRFSLTNLKSMFKETGFNLLKEQILTLIKNHPLSYLIKNNGSALKSKKQIEKLYSNPDDIFAVKVIRKWLNKKYLQKKTKIICDGVEKTNYPCCFNRVSLL